MLLLLTSAPCAQACAAAIQTASGITVRCVGSMRTALSSLHDQAYMAVIVDQGLLDQDPQGFERLLPYFGSAIPIHVNLALCNTERLVRDVQGALSRMQKERALALRAAAEALHQDLKASVTGILLAAELALALPSLPSVAHSKLRSIRELAQVIRQRLETATTGEGS